MHMDYRRSKQTKKQHLLSALESAEKNQMDNLLEENHIDRYPNPIQ